ncbi:MAG: sigma-E processing peptidase SpoIIGA [Clostridia bacterium]|nr:sigma-E processing peptidase SpoIIGA [Clostridia bacterium]
MEGIQYVYFEKVMFINISMNWLILWIAGRLGRVSTPAWRILAGAFFGALYSFTLLLPSLQWLVNFGTKVIFSVLMILIAFFPLPMGRTWRVMIYFYLTSFAVGGAIFGLSFLAVPGTPMGNMLLPMLRSILKLLDDHFWWLFPLVVFGALSFGYWAPALGKRLVETFCRVSFKISVDGKEKELVGLLDTGNQVRDPLSQFPVVIVELGAIRELLPPGIQDRLRERLAPEIWELMAGLEHESDWLERWRVLPFTSVGKAKGVLLGFRPDYIEFQSGQTTIKEKQVVVGLYHHPLSGDGSYRALLPSDWLEFLGRDSVAR